MENSEMKTSETDSPRFPSFRPRRLYIVVSLLMMLMCDQVAYLCEAGINSCFHNDLLSDAGNDFVLFNLQQPNC